MRRAYPKPVDFDLDQLADLEGRHPAQSAVEGFLAWRDQEETEWAANEADTICETLSRSTIDWDLRAAFQLTESLDHLRLVITWASNEIEGNGPIGLQKFLAETALLWWERFSDHLREARRRAEQLA